MNKLLPLTIVLAIECLVLLYIIYKLKIIDYVRQEMQEEKERHQAQHEDIDKVIEEALRG